MQTFHLHRAIPRTLILVLAFLGFFSAVPSGLQAQTNTFPNNGYVGIGTTIPNFALTIEGDIWDKIQLRLAAYAGTPAPGGTDNYTPQIRFEKSRGTSALPEKVEDGDRIGAFLAGGHDGNKIQRSAVFGFRVDGPSSAGDVPIGFFVQTGNSSSNKPERFLVKSNGEVVIKDLAGSGNRFVVANDTGLLSSMAINDNSATNELQTLSFNSGSGDLTISGGNTVNIGGGGGGADNDWAYNTGSGLTGEIYHMGYVGVGVTNPNFPLHIEETRVNSPIGYFKQLDLTDGSHAVQGNIVTDGPTKGYLGVQGTIDFNGIPGLTSAGDEIGVLGVSTGASSTDNFGVYGYSNGWSGFFLHSESGNSVRLGGNGAPIRIQDASIADPTGMVLVAQNASGLATWETPTSVDDEDWAFFSGSGDAGEIYHSGDVALGDFLDPNGNGLNVQNYTNSKAAVRGANQSGTFLYSEGMLGVLSPAGLGIPLSVTNAGVLGIKPNVGSNGAAVYGWNNDDNSTNYAGVFISDGIAASGTNYGVYAAASNGSKNLAGFFSGQVQLANGTEASLTSDGYLQVGLSSAQNLVIDDNEISSRVNGDTSILFLQPTEGNVHIGNPTSSVDAKLWVSSDNSSQNPLRIQVGGSTKMYVLGNGGTALGTFSTDAPPNGLYVSGDVTIGTGASGAATGYKLSVNGKIACEELLIDDSAFWPDYVFGDEYELMSIDQFAQHIREHKHLPGLPSASEVETDGILVGEMHKMTIEKVEELSLYIIEIHNRMKEMDQEVQNLKKENESLKAQLSK